MLTRLMEYVGACRLYMGPSWDGPVTLTPQEHDTLKAEIGSTGPSQILTIEGVKILVGSVSDLDPAPESEAVALAKKWLEKPLFLAKPIISGPPGMYLPGQNLEPELIEIPTVAGKTETETIWKAPKALTIKQPTKVYHKSGSDDHSTPQKLFDRLDDEFHFDLDVCATAPHEVPSWHLEGDMAYGGYMANQPMLDPGNAKCPVYFTPDDNGLMQHWFGRVWMNPPYTKGQVGVWIQKLLKELLAGRLDLAVALTAARPDTAWFQTVASYACEIRFLKGRLTFEGQKNAAPFPSVILVFDPTKTVQAVKFWDWQTGTAPVYWKAPGYGFLPGKPGHPGVAFKVPKPLALVK